MPPCCSAAAKRASPRNRVRAASSETYSRRSSFTATGRINSSSVASQTSPIPPVASWRPSRYRLLSTSSCWLMALPARILRSPVHRPHDDGGQLAGGSGPGPRTLGDHGKGVLRVLDRAEADEPPVVV